MKSIIYVELQNWSELIQLHLLHCYRYGFKLCYYYTKKMAANMCYSGSYELLHEAEFCTFKIWSCGLTRNLPFWVPMVDFNKYILEYKWLTKLTNCIFYIHYIFWYIFIYTYRSMFYNKPWKSLRSCLWMDTQLEHKEL